jgi:hypothetical protein
MTIDEIREMVDVEIAKNKTLLNLVDDEEKLFVKSAMVKAEYGIRKDGNNQSN